MLGFGTQMFRFASGYEGLKGLTDMFDLDREQNLPTFFSAALLLLCSGVLGIIALEHRRSERTGYLCWLGLALIFLFLAVDEASGIHELFIRPTRRLMGEWTTGLLAFAWVIPYSLFLAVFALIYVRFWWRLPRRTRWLMMLAAAIYLGGALIVELFSGRHVEAHGKLNVLYSLMVVLEESMEMAGAIVLLYALLDYLGRFSGTLRFSFIDDATVSNNPIGKPTLTGNPSPSR